MRGEHVKTQIFSLIGRHIVLHKPYNGYTEGMITEKIGPARYGCFLQKPTGEVYMSGEVGRPVTADFHRGEVVLPPLPKNRRKAVRLPDDSDGFAYANEPNF